MSTRNPNQIAPSPSFSERPGNTVSVVQATPIRNAVGQRAGEQYASEQLGWQPDVSSAFVGGTSSDREFANTYEVQQAGQANGRTPFNAASPPPSWNAVSDQVKAGFISGVSKTAGAAPNPYPWEPRDGHQSRESVISPLHAMNFGERPPQVYESKIAVNRARPRRNQADVSDL